MNAVYLSISALLGFLAFFEPCTIATHTLFAVRTGKTGRLKIFKELLQLGVSRFILTGGIILLAIVFTAPLQWGKNIPSVILTILAIVYIVSRFTYIPIPHLSFYKILPRGEKLPDSIQLGLTLPACTIPLFLTVAGLALTVHSLFFGLFAAFAFTLFFTLPTIYSALRGIGERGREILTATARATPFITAILFISAAFLLLIPELELSKSSLEEVLARPSLLALGIGFITGLVFSFNPVSFAAIPVALAYVTKAREKKRGQIMGLAFIAGLIVTHVILGVAAAAGGEWAGSIMGRQWAALLGGLLLFLGLLWTGWIKINLPWFGLSGAKVNSVWGAFLLGIPFSIAVCPFCSPALLVMLTASASIGSLLFGFALLFAFAVGRSVPILLGAWSMAWLESLSFFTRWQKSFEVGGGITLILSGLYLMNEYFFVL